MLQLVRQNQSFCFSKSKSSFCATVMPTETWKMKNENLHITPWVGFLRYCAKTTFYSRGPANDHGNASASERNTCFVKPQTRIFFFFWTKHCLLLEADHTQKKKKKIIKSVNRPHRAPTMFFFQQMLVQEQKQPVREVQRGREAREENQPETCQPIQQ